MKTTKSWRVNKPVIIHQSCYICIYKPSHIWCQVVLACGGRRSETKFYLVVENGWQIFWVSHCRTMQWFYGWGHICYGIMTGVSQMEHEVCAYLWVWMNVCACACSCTCGWKGELMSLLWAIIRTLAPHSAIIKANIAELPNRGTATQHTPLLMQVIKHQLVMIKNSELICLRITSIFKYLFLKNWSLHLTVWNDSQIFLNDVYSDCPLGSGSAVYWQLLKIF